MFLGMIILLVRNENWTQVNVHETKDNKSLKKDRFIRSQSHCSERATYTLEVCRPDMGVFHPIPS